MNNHSELTSISIIISIQSFLLVFYLNQNMISKFDICCYDIMNNNSLDF